MGFISGEISFSSSDNLSIYLDPSIISNTTSVPLKACQAVSTKNLFKVWLDLCMPGVSKNTI